MTPINKRGTLKVEYVPIKSVKPAKNNTRVHPPEQIDQVAKSIQSFGWTKPIVVDERREILAGHGAYQAAQHLGMTEVPIIARHGLTQAQKRAYRTADNKIGENSAWDQKILASELLSLKEMGFDMSLTGFKPGEIDALLRPSPGPDTEPRTPDGNGPIITKVGDLWQLGEHRVMCADSTKPATYEALMDGRQAACVFTDPPYGVSYGEGRPTDRHPKRFELIEGDQHRRGDLVKMLTGAFGAAMKATKQDAAWYIWHGSVTRRDFEDALQAVGLIEPANGYIVWVKPATMGWSNYKSAFEPCFYVHRQGYTPQFHGDRTQTTVWEAAARTANGAEIALGGGVILASEAGEIMISNAPKGRALRHHNLSTGETIAISSHDDQTNVWTVGRGKEGEDRVHPTQKPVELARRAIRNSTRENEIVLDFFAGSGSTLIACEQLIRACYCVDLEPRYVDAIITRWQSATGKQAIHAGEKKTYDAIAKARTSKAKARAA